MNTTPTEQTSGPVPDLLPNGFRFAGVACGIKASGKPDLSLIVADHPIVAAGVYTRNQVVAAPVVWCRHRTPSDSIRAVVTNSGNANSCTGNQGIQDTAQMADWVAGHLDCDPTDVLVMSTGVIGHPLPMDRVRDGIEHAFAARDTEHASFLAAANAILTTDKSRKVVAHTLPGRPPIRTVAMAKGAGMIAPNMATMLAVICTDASLGIDDAQRLVANAAALSFNRASVDDHTSTNDTFLLLASGRSEPLAGQELEQFGEVISGIAIQLAKEMVADGEGASHVMVIQVVGADDDQAAESIARRVAASPLVKTAIAGGDPNWGRIVSAAGNAGPPIDADRISLEICRTPIFQQGTPLAIDATALSQTMSAAAEVEIKLTVGAGSGQATYFASDLTTEYVRFNSEYTT